jgi:uncharacterized protein HemX
MDLTALLPSLILIVGAIAGGLVGIVGVGFGYLQGKAKAKADLQVKKDNARADFELMKENARLATQAAEQLGKTNEERAELALKLQARWNQMAGITLPADKNLNEANVPTIVPVPMASPDPTAKG